MSSQDDVDKALNPVFTSYHFIGNHLVWFTDAIEGISYIKLFENRDQTLQPTTKAQRYKVNTFDLFWLAENIDEDQILIEEVPDYSYYYVKKFDENKNLVRY